MYHESDSFSSRLAAAVKHKGSPVCVGLDPRKKMLPKGLLPATWFDETEAVAQAYRTFCCGIIDVVAPLVPMVKPQVAFFEQLGPAGSRALKKVINYARKAGLLVLLDGKRNDIGSTAEAYADGYLGVDSAWGCDALTINPYLGKDSMAPFVATALQRHAGLFSLVKSSNPESGMFQDLEFDGKRLYQIVADCVESLAVETADATGYGVIGAVVGATYPDELAELRQRMPHAWFLVPGFGSQGGTAADVKSAFDDCGLGAIINSSRSIIFAHERPDFDARFGHSQWQEAVDAATREMVDQLA